MDELEPPSWRALEYVKQLVQKIRPSAGYLTTIGDGLIVLEDDQAVEAGNDVPVTFIEAQDFDTTSATHARTVSEVSVLIEFNIPFDAGIDNPKRLAHRGRYDLVRALMVKVTDLPGFVTSLAIDGGRLLSTTDEQAGTRFAIAQVTARVGLTETK